MFIVEPFNSVFLVAASIFIALLAVSTLLLKNSSRKTRRIVLGTAMTVSFVIFWIYKLALSKDAEYSELCASLNIGAFSWWKELPIQLCNINMMIIPLACLFDSKRLYSFSFFVAPIGALMALITPCAGFAGYSIFLPRNLGFYYTHFMIIICGLAIACFNLYRPEFKDIPGTMLTMFAITALVVGIDYLLKFTVEPYANYFYALNTEGISILDFFWNLLPVPGVYLLLCGICILLPYTLVITLFFRLGSRIYSKRAHDEPAEAR